MNALTDILSHPFVHKLGWTLVHLLWQGAAVAVLLGIVLRLLRKCSANLRYVVACSALAVVVVLPVVTICLVPAPPSYALLEAESASLQAPMGEAMRIVPVNLESVESFGAMGLKQRAVNLLEPALPYIVAGWVLGVFALSLYHLGGWTHLQRLRRKLTKQANESLLQTLSALTEKLKVTRPVRLVESALVQIPTVVGWVRPVILLPATALTGLTGDQVEALLAHELAHIRRGDYLVNMLQTVVEILGFYHPAVWWISNKIRLERENCCDDLAVATCGDKMHYATALAEMERIRSTQGELAMAANGGNLLMRIRRLIGKSPTPKQRFNWAAALITALVIAALAIPTTLALSRSRAVEDTAEAATVETVELDEVRPPSPASVSGETGKKAQILFELKLFELRADSKLIKDAAKEDGTFVRTDKAFAEQLLELAKKSKEAKTLTAPRVTVIEGEDAMFTVSNEIPYIAGYSEQPDGEPKPIIKYLHPGFEAKVKGDLVGDNAIFVRLLFKQTVPTLTTHKVAKGREIQIPIIRATECATSATIGDNSVVIIGGLGDLQSPEKPDHTLIVQIVSHIVRKGDADSLTGPLPISDSSKEVSFTVSPQVITSVGVDTEGAPPYTDSGNRPAKAVKRLIAMLKGERSLSFELLDSKMAVAGQLDDLRKLIGEQSVEILLALSDGDHTLIATKSLKDDGGREGHLVFHLSREKDKWTIDDIDFEDPQGLEDEMKRFDEEMRKARQALSGSSMGVTGRPDEAVGEKAEKTPPQVRVFALQYADASALSKILNSLLPNEDKDWEITADPSRSNRLIVLASETDFEPFTKLIKLLDVPQAGAGTPAVETVTRIVQLKYADSQQVVTMLTNLSVFGRNSRVVSDGRLNQLIIQAPEAEIKKITDLIREIDRPVDEKAAKTQSSAKDKQLAMLIDHREALAEKMQSLREAVNRQQRELGITESAKQQDLMLQRTSSLLTELGKTESLRMQLEAQLSLLDQGDDQSVSPQERLKMRQEYVNSDATVKALAERIAEVEMELLLANQTKGGDNPEVKNKISLLNALKNRLAEAKKEVGRAFDKLMAVEDDKAHQQNIARAKTEIGQNVAYEKKLRDRLKQENAKTNAMAQSQLEVQALRDELDVIKAMYDEINRRIMDLRMQPQMPMLYDIGESGTK